MNFHQLIILVWVFNITFGKIFRVVDKIYINSSAQKEIFTRFLTKCLYECSSRDYDYINTNISVQSVQPGACRCLMKNNHDETWNSIKQNDWYLFSVFKQTKEECMPISIPSMIKAQINETCWQCAKKEKCGEGSKNFAFENVECLCIRNGSACITKSGEVKNLALDGIATTSSSYGVSTNVKNVNDGKFLFNKDNSSYLSHTITEEKPWISIQLESMAYIYKIRVVNRFAKITRDRLSDMVILIGNSTNNMINCVDKMDAKDNLDIHLFCKQGRPMAQYVKLQLMRTAYLHIQELEIYGVCWQCVIKENCEEGSKNIGFEDFECACVRYGSACITESGPVKNLALDGIATMSSVKQLESNETNANDGKFLFDKDKKSYISHTNFEENPWISIQLNSVAYIYKIRVVNRFYRNIRERLNDMVILIGNSTNNMITCVDKMDANQNLDIHLFCKQGRPMAKYVKLQVMKTAFLHIQELEIYGVSYVV